MNAPHTIAELEALLEQGQRFELVNGELVEEPFATVAQGVTSAEMVRLIQNFLQERPIGTLAIAVGVQLSTDDLLNADIAFVASERITRSAINENGWLAIAPDLVVEFTQKQERDFARKLAIWFRHGVKQVWIIYPNRHKVMVYRSETDIQVLLRDDVLSGGDILPGFEVRVRSLFAGLDFLET